MKKLALLSLFTLALGITNSNAQTTTDNIFQKYRFGLYLGPTFNSYKPTAATADDYNVEKVKGNVGFSFGIQGELNVNERYTLFSGLGMDWRGGSINATLATGKTLQADYIKSAEIRYKHQYLSIPIGLKMKAAEVDQFKIYAQTGFDLGLLLSQKGDYTYLVADTSVASGYKSVTKEDQKLGGYARAIPVNLGWSIGIGTEYAFNDKNAAFATILYRNGFTDITTPKTNDKGVRFSDGNIRSNTIAIRIGYYF